ncbi:MAG: hypothetical protein Q8O29_17935 [Polaromonas sp.]|nr:hypothetical protein [Polaromonas sp.]
MQVVHHPLTQPVRGVVLAKSVSGVDVYQFLIHTLENVFFDIGEVVLTNLVVKLAQRRCQLLKKFRAADPIEKITLNQVGDIQGGESLSRQYGFELIVAGTRCRFKNCVGQQFGKNTQIGMNQVHRITLVKLAVSQLQKPLPLLKGNMHH